MKPGLFTLILHWISANSQHGFAARSHFIFLTIQFQISHGNTAALSIHFCWTLLSEQMKPRLLPSIVQLGLWISTISSHGFVARSNFVFLTTQFQVCHGNTATFFIELRDETTIISVDGTTGIVVKCWVSSRRNIDRASMEATTPCCRFCFITLALPALCQTLLSFTLTGSVANNNRVNLRGETCIAGRSTSIWFWTLFLNSWTFDLFVYTIFELLNSSFI